MVINDLKSICPQCKGSGHSAGVTRLGISQINPGGVCPTCKGLGFVLTGLGEDLIKLLRPFILKMIEEASPPTSGKAAPVPPPAEEGN